MKGRNCERTGIAVVAAVVGDVREVGGEGVLGDFWDIMKHEVSTDWPTNEPRKAQSELP